MSRVFFTFILLIDPYRPYSVGMKKCPLPDNPWDWLRPLSWPCTLYKCINSVLVKSQFLGCASNKNLPQTTDSETLSSSIYHSRVCRILDGCLLADTLETNIKQPIEGRACAWCSAWVTSTLLEFCSPWVCAAVPTVIQIFHSPPARFTNV